VCVYFGIVSSSLERWLVLVAAVLACLKAEKKSNFRAVLDSRVGPLALAAQDPRLATAIIFALRTRPLISEGFIQHARQRIYETQVDLIAFLPDAAFFFFFGKVGVGVSNGGYIILSKTSPGLFSSTHDVVPDNLRKLCKKGLQMVAIKILSNELNPGTCENLPRPATNHWIVAFQM